MRKWIIVLCILLPLAVLAGEKKMIKNFDEQGLKQLNNLLFKQDKLIRKLMKQQGTSTTTIQPSGTNDLVPETILDGIEQEPVIGIAREDGRIEAWVEGDVDNDVSPTKTAYIHETQAKIAVPSSYFLDLRGIWKSTSTQQYTADLAILHDTSGNTITLTNLDETNDINDVQTGSVAGGRDQADAFDSNGWIHFFFIYNPVTKDVSSLSSASPTAPTLPTGYTFFVRTGPGYVDGSGELLRSYQMGDKVTYDMQWPKFGTHAGSANEAVDVSAYIPATAKMIHGTFGLSEAETKYMYVASDSGLKIKVVSLCHGAGTGSTVIGATGTKEYSLPVLTAQTIYWGTEGSTDVYALGISGFTDDL